MKLTKIFFSFLLFCSSIALASDFTAVISFEKTNNGLIMKSQTVDNGIPFKGADETVIQKLKEVTDQREAIVYGRIDYERGNEGILKPVFIIERLTFVSLKDLGTISYTVPERDFSLDSTTAFIPYTFPVTSEVASALTLTSSLLLMNSLTAGPDRDVRDDIRAGLFLSAGTMATILFLYEQLSGKTKP